MIKPVVIEGLKLKEGDLFKLVSGDICQCLRIYIGNNNSIVLQKKELIYNCPILLGNVCPIVSSCFYELVSNKKVC